MEAFHSLLGGFGAALSQNNLIACFAGTVIGTVVGVLPGIGPTGAMALLLPFSFGLDPATGLILIAGIYYGAMYGGSTTSILVNVPGEAASLVTCFDGYQMAKKGRAGAALAVAAIGSWVAGTAGVVGLMLFAPPLGKAALAFGPPEYFAISVFGIIILCNVSGGSFIRSILMVIFGVLISSIGTDPLTGFNRFTFKVTELSGGIELLPVVMGLFGLAEIFSVAVNPYATSDVIKVRLKDLYPTSQELKRSIFPILRGTGVGFPMGLIPGPAAFLSSFISYKLEKILSKHPEEFGKGAIEGVAGPESANNAAAAGSMVPLLALGIPFAPPTAILLGGFMIHGITPGPLFITQHADLFWAVLASMYIGNIMLLVLNLPLVGVFASFTRVPARILLPIIGLIMFVGAYSVNNSIFDLWILLIFGLLGFAMKYFGFEPAPIVIGLVLGTVFEQGLRQGLTILDGNFFLFFTRPISGSLLGAAILVLVVATVLKVVRGKKTIHSTDVKSRKL